MFNIINVFVVKCFTIFLSFIFSIVLTNTLSQSDVGVFLTGITLMTAISIFIKSGFDTHIIRINALSLNKFSNYLILTILTFIPYILILILINIYFKESNIFVYFIIASWCISYFGISAAYLKSLGKIKIATLIEISLLHLFVMVIYILSPAQINLEISVLIFLCVSLFLSLIIALILFKKNKFVIFKWKLDLKNNFKNSFSIMITDLLDFLVIWTPSFFLFYYATEEIAAQFQIALRVTFLLALPAVVFNSISSPIIALYLKKKLNSKLSELLQFSSLIGTLITTILILLLLMFREFVFGMFGDKYILEISILILLFIGQFINVLSTSVGLTLTLSGNGWIYCQNYIIAIIISIILAMILIPQNFLIGAAISTSSATIIKNLLNLFYVNKILKIYSIPVRNTFFNLKINKINEIFSYRD